jgi:hypothetical protein
MSGWESARTSGAVPTARRVMTRGKASRHTLQQCDVGPDQPRRRGADRPALSGRNAAPASPIVLAPTAPLKGTPWSNRRPATSVGQWCSQTERSYLRIRTPDEQLVDATARPAQSALPRRNHETSVFRLQLDSIRESYYTTLPRNCYAALR